MCSIEGKVLPSYPAMRAERSVTAPRAQGGSYDTSAETEGGSVISCFQSSEMQIRVLLKSPGSPSPNLL